MGKITAAEYHKFLCNTGKFYRTIGYSVIPVWGDVVPDRAKVAAVNWKQFQKRFAFDAFIDHWFNVKKYGGLAIVTGSISRLVVVDFDSVELLTEFRQQFPHLLNTRIITSPGRGLPHYYYRLPANTTLPTIRLDGADLLSDGAYVIAPPTMIAGNTYDIIQGGKPYQLNPYDTNQLLDFFQKRNDRYAKVTTQHQNIEKSPITIAQSNTKTEQCSKHITLDSLIRLYQHYAPHIGRNNALFKVACHGRNHLLSQQETQRALQSIHARQLPNHAHKQQSEQSRIREAEKTIASAFSYPPVPPLPKQDTIGLTNSIREALLQQGLTCVARVLDGLYAKGFRAGDVITMRIVTEALKGTVGRYSIIKTFSASLNDNQPIFEVTNPPPRTPTHTSVAEDSLKETNKKCFLFSQTKPNKTSVGRVATHFIVPDVNTLCARLDVPFTRSDPLTWKDIEHAKTYRQAIHRELIKRRPGLYHRYWLARRLGVSKRTCQRYDRGAGVNSQPMFIREKITWHNVHGIPLDDPIAGRFLEGHLGKRYPPLRQIAIRLLAQKQTVNYCYQDKNYYWYGDDLPLMSIKYGIHPEQEAYDAQFERHKAHIQAYWRDFHTKQHVSLLPKSSQKVHRKTPDAPLLTPTEQGHQVRGKQTPKSKRYYSKPLPDNRAEVLAQRLYRAIWDRATEEKTRLSQANARRLVEQYDTHLIYRALGILKHRQNISNPAGFMVTYLRSTAKSY